ncbi:AAA family ATPase [Arachnia propionica]|uniref:AAA family ATPase n=1 Tax=Arachnia propionica TaxID=1750 RepID=A0A3P1T1K2_9ACTN|nr:ATP-binding protein [Arachnia propionica]RRD03377.1 AAA family ATPase [Arachnia propionica]
MLLLSFTVQNHGSIRDEAVLEFTRPSLTGFYPSGDQTWVTSTYPAAGIFGANASGKSTVVDALRYVLAAIRDSASEWLSRETMPRGPFQLDDRHRDEPSRYELEFVLDGRRHTYGFEVDGQGVVREWLLDRPTSKPRSLFKRERERVSYGRGVRTVGLLAAHELLISRAIKLDHEPLATIGRGLLEGFDLVPFGEGQRRTRIGAIVADLKEGRSTPEAIAAVLRIADVGITEVNLREDPIPLEDRERMARFETAFREALSSLGETEGEPLSEPATEAVIRRLEFLHGHGVRPFSLRQESDGTLAWLALAIPAINQLRRGGVFVVDELDSSLHPHLAEILIGFFQDPKVNTTGAQILFTSHDTYLLSNLSHLELAKGQIWFTEKERDGATELFSLADFTTHSDHNIAKRYLEGRYGAVPALAPSLIHSLLSDDETAA